MPDKKPRRLLGPPWQSVLDRLDSFGDRIGRGIESTRALVEDIRSDNRSTLEAVEATRVALEQRIERLDQETRARDFALEMAIRELRLDLRQLQGDVKVLQEDVRGVTAKVEALARLEERVTALEKRLRAWRHCRVGCRRSHEPGADDAATADPTARRASPYSWAALVLQGEWR